MASDGLINNTSVPRSGQLISDDLTFIFRALNFGVICLAIAVFGCVTNIINMVIFSKIGFKDTINISLLAMAISDFGFCFTLILLCLGVNPWIVVLDLPFIMQETVYLTVSCPNVTFTKITTLITAFITFERCLCVTIPLKIKTLITRRRVKIVLVCSYIIMWLFLVPVYAVNYLGWKYYPSINRSKLGIVFSEHREEAEKIYSSLNSAVSIMGFLFISINTAILVFNLKRKAEWRQKATSVKASNDTSSKEKRISKMVVLVSSLYIVCFFPNELLIVLMVLDREISITGARINFLVSYSSFIVTISGLNSSMNVIIYYFNSSSYRSMFNQVFGIKTDGQKQ